MATIASGIKISQQVSGEFDFTNHAGAGGQVGAGSVVYTAPANGYAIIYMYLSASSSTSGATCSGIVAGTAGGLSVGAGSSSGGSFSLSSLYIGPSQVVSISISAGPLSSGYGFITGVEFINS